MPQKLRFCKPVRAEASCQHITQHQRRQAVRHDTRPVDHCRVMPPVDLKLCILAAEEIDRFLRLVDRRRRLDGKAEEHRHPVGNAAVDAAVVIGGGGDSAVLHPEGIIVHAARLVDQIEGIPELHALDRRNAEECMRQHTLQGIEPRLPDACRQTRDDRFQNAAHAVAVCGSRFNAFAHGCGSLFVEHGEGHFLHRRNIRRRIGSKGSVRDPRTPCNMGADLNALSAQRRDRNRAARHDPRRDPAAEMAAAAVVLVAVIFRICREIRMSRPCQCSCRRIVLAAGLAVRDHDADGRTRRLSFKNAADDLVRILLLPRRGDLPRRRHRGMQAPVHPCAHGCHLRREDGLHEEDRAVIGNATGCLEVSSYMYPYTAWEDSYIHNAFENAGATMSGVETAYNVLKKKGKINDTYKFITFGGDGGTYDIGFQSLSGAMERGHDFVYVCYDNGAYMNTGTQRSSATPKFADTTTTPAGKASSGKVQIRKDLAAIMAAHQIPYVGQTTFIGNFKDIYTKSEKAIYTPGPAFLNVLSPCPRGWGYDPSDMMKICKLAVDTCYWPMFEVVDGKWILSYEPKNKLPIEDFLKPQRRFKHLFKPGNEGLIEEFQRMVDEQWNNLLVKCNA